MKYKTYFFPDSHHFPKRYMARISSEIHKTEHIILLQKSLLTLNIDAYFLGEIMFSFLYFFQKTEGGIQIDVFLPHNSRHPHFFFNALRRRQISCS